MSDIIRTMRMLAPPGCHSSDAAIPHYPNTYASFQSQAEAQQRQQERLSGRVVRASRQAPQAESVQPIRIPSNNNFFINLPVN